MNSLLDKEVIAKLYEASAAGVKILIFFIEAVDTAPAAARHKYGRPYARAVGDVVLPDLSISHGPAS
jgi:hypothetical protein